jgi:preprotein translocase subunit Sec61beta
MSMPYSQSGEEKLSIPERILGIAFAIAIVIFAIRILLDIGGVE